MLIIDTTEYSEEVNASLSADKQVQSNYYLHDYFSNACYLTMLLVQVSSRNYTFHDRILEILIS